MSTHLPKHDAETVLLFFKKYERDSLLPYDRYLKRLVRPLYNRLRRTQKVSGFRVWCDLLITALSQQGYRVHLNNFSLAFHNPHHPVGLIGYPHLLDGWSLPNPAVLGPALYDHPQQDPTLLSDPRFRSYLVTCDWMYDVFKPAFGDQVGSWYAGMDTTKWPDTRYDPKHIDVLIYDKIRWNRDQYEATLLQPILRQLDERGITYHIIRYRQYDHAMYRDLLSQSRAMIFLCEHETQGMAYQEALASNLPLLAWDQGWWLDPNRERFSSKPIAASSVPYWSTECGEKFRDITAFPAAFERFWSQLDRYEPRRFVERSLSFSGSAERYMSYYRAAAAVEEQTR